jgi:hypothetical protein
MPIRRPNHCGLKSGGGSWPQCDRDLLTFNHNVHHNPVLRKTETVQDWAECLKEQTGYEPRDVKIPLNSCLQFHFPPLCVIIIVKIFSRNCVNSCTIDTLFLSVTGTAGHRVLIQAAVVALNCAKRGFYLSGQREMHRR